MQPSTSLRSAVRSTTRRRRPTPLPTTIPSVDLIGPPCPLSNLRPVYYAPLFPSSHSPPSIKVNHHPYQLQEFGTPSSGAGGGGGGEGLDKLRRQLQAKDLEWRLMRYRLDAFNQQFWSKTNTAFLLARDRYVASLPPSTSPSSSYTTSEQGVKDIDLSPFYAQHLQQTKQVYAAYNRELWKQQASLIWPSLKALARGFNWRWAVWRAGGER